MDNFSPSNLNENVTCPACGLSCDDLTVASDTTGKLAVTQNGCAKSITFFGRSAQTPSPRISGKTATLNEAVAQAAQLLTNANLPLFAGLGTEVQGMRAIMSLAEKCSGTLDHMNSAALMRNVAVVQNVGWQVATLTEVRNRADVLLIIDTDIISLLPRFFERVLWNKDSMFDLDTTQRQIIYLGDKTIDTRAGTSPDGRQPWHLKCDATDIPAVVAALNALLLGKLVHATSVAGIATDELRQLAETLKTAKYGVVAWAAPGFTYPHAELTIQTITEVVKTLNQTTRYNGLPLGGSDGDMSVNQVCTWISGYPVRTSYSRGIPEYDPLLFSAERLINEKEVDVLVWVSSFNPDRTPPPSSAPTIVLGHTGMTFAQPPEVFIPVATPGLDCNGVMFRMDSVVSLPLEAVCPSSLPTLTQVATAIEDHLR